LIGVLGVSGKRIALTDFLLCAGLAYMGLLAGRNIAIFALAAPVIITRHAEGIVANKRVAPNISDTNQSSGRIAINWAILCLVFVAVVIKVGMVLPTNINQDYFEKSLPVSAVRYLAAHDFNGNLFNSYNWGGYLLWSLPQYPVFIDGRTDLYDDAIINQWLQVVRAEDGWQDVLNRWDVHLVLLEKDLPITKILPLSGWEQAYLDERAVIFRR
jgi:hypothetical protein